MNDYIFYPPPPHYSPIEGIAVFAPVGTTQFMQAVSVTATGTVTRAVAIVHTALLTVAGTVVNLKGVGKLVNVSQVGISGIERLEVVVKSIATTVTAAVVNLTTTIPAGSGGQPDPEGRGYWRRRRRR